MHLSLIHNIPDDLRKHIDDHYARTIQYYPAKRLTMWPMFRVQIENRECQLITQSSLQYLTFHQCVISRCLFGYTLSQGNSCHGPIISNNLAEYYLETGIKLVKKFETEIDLSWLLQSRSDLWKQLCCLYLSHAYQNENSSKDVVKFAEQFINFQAKKAVA
jgi:hypothetical protein